MENVKVTVVLSTYNQAPYVAQALDSILMQKTNFPFEILAADDHSTDGTQEIILDYQKRFPDRIVTYFTPENIGDCQKFVNCIDMGLLHGEYLAHLEGDDYWLREDRLQLLADFLDANPEYSRVSHRTLIVDENGNEKGYDMPPEKSGRRFTVENFLAGEQYSDIDSMYRNYYRQAGKKYHSILLASKNLSDFQDMFITQDFGPVYILPDCLSAYRSRSTQGAFNYNSFMSAERRSVDKITVVKAVENFYAGRYDLSPRVFREQKKLIANAIRMREASAFSRARSYVPDGAMRRILPRLVYQLFRSRNHEGLRFLKAALTAKEKSLLMLDFLPYCFRRWFSRSKRTGAEDKIRGRVVRT